MWQIRAFQPSNVALCVDANAFLDETRRDTDAVHDRGAHYGAQVALAVLVDAHVGIEICLSCRSPMGSDHPNWIVLNRVFGTSSGRISRQRTPRASGPKILHLPFASDREHAHALQHVTAKAQSCQAVFRSSCQRWPRTGLKHRDISGHELHADGARSQLCRRKTSQCLPRRRVSAKTSVVRRRFSERDWSGAPRRNCLTLRLDALHATSLAALRRISRGF